MSGDALPLLTDAELDSRRGGFFKGHFAEGAPVTEDTLKRAEAAIKRLEKRAKERAEKGVP